MIGARGMSEKIVPQQYYDVLLTFYNFFREFQFMMSSLDDRFFFFFFLLNNVFEFGEGVYLIMCV